MRKNQEQMIFARELRRKQTDAEKTLWARLRNEQLEGVKFRRQQLLGSYIVDFVSFERKIVVEVDGGQHNESSLFPSPVEGEENIVLPPLAGGSQREGDYK